MWHLIANTNYLCSVSIRKLNFIISELQSWTKVLTHLRKTNTFYRYPSVIEKKTSFLSIANDSPSPPFQCWNTLRGHCHMVTTLKRGEGIEMWKLEMEKLMHSTKQVFFGECLNYFCPWLWLYCIFLVLHDSYMTIPQNKLLSSSHYCIQKN